MLSTHRRSFLGGLFGAAAAASLPTGQASAAVQQQEPRRLDPDQDAKRIVNEEIVPALTIAIRASGKNLAAGALDQWAPKLEQTVLNHLKAGGDWKKTRDTVLSVASGMGSIAAILSYTDPVVSQGRIHAAFRAVKSHGACPGVTKGAWCDFDI